jgi:hypothetical protein
MAIGWLAAFKTIPWKEVLVAAPPIVQGARKLWSSVTRKEEPISPPSPQFDDKLSSHSEALAAIDARLALLESRTKEISDEAVSSSELIKSLAEQNSRLVQAVEILRIRTRALLWLSSVLGLAIVGLFLWLLLR